MLSFFYNEAASVVPSKLIVNGNAAATARSIAASETLFRIGIAYNLICQILYVGGEGFVRSAQSNGLSARLADAGD